ncbi:hypothetical protein HHI36_007341 [Cryptolaemus montrouzieri]|uniref:Uncharacterized protein n=1 Tax=Cryptolaemus montrouzieri TaxID=559131 RepID=A0ABD2MPC6_9CUCU
MLYPVLQMLSDFYIQDMHEDSKKEIEEIFGHIYIKFENSLHKLVRKPQKAGQHLDTNYQGLISLVEINFQMESFLEYVSKVQKFEVTKIYHAKLLNTIFKKFIDKDTDSKIICNTLLTFVHLLMNILKKFLK